MTLPDNQSQSGSPPGTGLINATRTFLVLCACLWLFLAIGNWPANPVAEPSIDRYLIPLVMLLNGAIFLLVAWGLGRGSHALFLLGFWWVWLNLILLLAAAIVMLSQRSTYWFFDLVILLIPIPLLVMFFAIRKHFGVKW